MEVLMIHYIKGELAFKLEDRIVVETGGVGFEIFVPSNSGIYSAREGEEVRVYTLMIVKEDDMSLYGFMEKQSLNLFNKLLSVSGVGAKAALSLLSALSPGELSKAIVFGDAAMLSRANGVGKKTAERIILELKDKTEIYSDTGLQQPKLDVSGFGPGDPGSEAIEALISLGYSKSEAVSAVASVQGEQLSTEEYIRLALKSQMVDVRRKD
jgi:Holliday junction DNA helicase RuvA